jgi:RNA polymerase sigma-B factor
MAAIARLPAGRGLETKLLLRRYAREHAPADREALAARFEPLARSLAMRFIHTSEPFDDLLQVARLALLKAIDRFDPERGTAFTSLAVPTITGELRRHLRDHSWPIHVPRELQELTQKLAVATPKLVGRLGRQPTTAELADALGTDMETVLEARAAARAHSPDSLDRPLSEEAEGGVIGDLVAGDRDDIGQAETRAVAQRYLARLPHRNRAVLLLRYHEDLKQREIGELLGISQMHVSRLIRQSLEMLRGIAAEEDSLPRPVAG